MTKDSTFSWRKSCSTWENSIRSLWLFSCQTQLRHSRITSPSIKKLRLDVRFCLDTTAFLL